MKDFAATVAAIFGIHDGVAYVLLNNGILKDRSVNGGNVLTRKTLEVIQADLADAINCDPPIGATGGALDGVLAVIANNMAWSDQFFNVITPYSWKAVFKERR